MGECGTAIDPNPANLCVGCLRTQVDITEGIPKQVTIHFCKFCERYLQPPQAWIAAALESRELMALCLKKLKGLAAVKLIDASFLWTEPHSKKLKLKTIGTASSKCVKRRSNGKLYSFWSSF